MSAVDTRTIARDSLFLLAEVSLGGADPVRVKVRNLSSGGVMAEGDVHPQRGTHLSINLRNIGWIEGSVAWTQDNRFGIAFDSEIDPKLVRSAGKTHSDFEPPRFVRTAGLGQSRSNGPARKI